MVLVTDQELTPDPQLLPGTVRQPKQPSMVQYMFFANYLDSNRIISIKTLDPLTWGQEVDDAPAIVKHRARALCCRRAGLLLGFNFCPTPYCFLQGYLRSPDSLDRMVYVCDQHTLRGDAPGNDGRLAALQWHGFETRPVEPGLVQDVREFSKYLDED